jgi:glycosyltransferase involved in cell wall biosynthesis
LNPLFLLNEFVNIVRGTLRGLRILRSNRFDLVVTNHSISTLMVKLRHPTQATVHFIHDGLHAHRSVRHIPEKVVRFFLNDVLELMAARAADRDLCASNGIQSQLLGSGIPASKTVAIGPLVSSPPDQPPGPVDSNPEPVLRPPYLLSVGQQVGRKRFDVLIRAMKNVPSEISLVLVGDGPLHDSYAELAREENLTERVVFLNGVGEGQLDRLYAGAELFVLVSENEGFPISVAEARAKGRPVLFASPSVASWSGASDPGLTVMPFVPSAEDLGRKLTDVLATTEGKELGSSDWSPLPPAQPVLEHDVVALYDQFLAAG